MVRSPGFGSSTHDWNRTFRTRFRFGFGPETLNLAVYANSPGHYAKGTPSPLSGLRPLVGARFQVLFHSPNRGTFHLSLALLFTIGHQGVLSLARWAALLHARFHGTGATQEICWRSVPFAYGAVTLFGPPFQTARLGTNFVTPCHFRNSGCSSYYPACATPTGLTHTRFGLIPFRSPLLRESMSLSLPAGTEMGQFPALPTDGYVFTVRSRGYSSCRFRISEIPGSTLACSYPRLFAA